MWCCGGLSLVNIILLLWRVLSLVIITHFCCTLLLSCLVTSRRLLLCVLIDPLRASHARKWPIVSDLCDERCFTELTIRESVVKVGGRVGSVFYFSFLVRVPSVVLLHLLLRRVSPCGFSFLRCYFPSWFF